MMRDGEPGNEAIKKKLLDELEELLKKAMYTMKAWRAARTNALHAQAIAEEKQIAAQDALDAYLLQCKELGIFPSKDTSS